MKASAKRKVFIFMMLVVTILVFESTHAATPMVASGGENTIALKSDGMAGAWGDNKYGSFGDGTDTNPLTSTAIPQLSDIASITGGLAHTVTLRSDGTVWTWGVNNHGQLGNGIKTTKYSPIMLDYIDDVIAIAAGLYHTVALKSDGTVWSWGFNTYGQLGDGTTEDKSTPTLVENISDVIAHKSSGPHHSNAFKKDLAKIKFFPVLLIAKIFSSRGDKFKF